MRMLLNANDYSPMTIDDCPCAHAQRPDVTGAGWRSA